MRAEKWNDGTVKAFLILVLLVANIALSVFAPPPARARETSNSVGTPPAKHDVARP